MALWVEEEPPGPAWHPVLAWALGPSLARTAGSPCGPGLIISRAPFTPELCWPDTWARVMVPRETGCVVEQLEG